MRITIIAILAIAVIAIGASLWISGNRPASSEAARDFLSAPKDYDTSGGQEMRPRWNE